ncbi:rho GTPase-activating protein 45 isoform X3 [Danio rerio]|uniref:Rho GTPase-activating protein 45 isoform X3 n=1 Tax=Danio rerio TaxID=7955 RepID=A0A8M2BIT8_DANRE|nr:rho GTPase-activating protein 45-like isoform X3 [Danio rerio]|eukprot:XP_005171523.1 rho GTPase-activating protein 45-like isoform X3 [Danio rerio]
MFSRKKKEQATKTPTASKKSNSAQNPSEHSQNDTMDGSSMLTPPDSVALSCPGTPCAHSRLSGCSSPVGTVRRPPGLSRHASAAGFPFQTSGTWGFHKGYVRAPLNYGQAAEGLETSVIEVEDIPSLLRDVARFAEAVEKLKDMVLGEVKEEPRSRPAVHECLGEVLRVLRQVISTYPLLNTVETLTAAGTLISKVKGFSYEGTTDAQKKDFEKAIETIAVAFSSNVSELLMGEIDSTTLLSLPPTEKSRSMEDLYRLSSGQGPEGGGKYDQQDCISPQEVDILLQRSEGGVDSALSYSKSIAKYMKDIISYVDKRIALENEFSKGLQRLYQSCKQNIIQDHMPLLSIFSLALEQDSEQSCGLQQTTNNIYTHSFLQPMTQRRQEHEKKRRDIKEQWQRAKRKLADAESNLRKARQLYMSRCEEYERARTVANKVEEEQSGTGSGSTTKALDRKRRLEEEARNKAEEAEATYRTCIADATTQQQELEDMKVNVLKQIQELIRQTDQILRACTISYYQTMHVQTAALPVHFQTLCESCKLFDPGQQYAAYVKNLQLRTERPLQYQFEPYSASSHQQLLRTRNNSLSNDQRQNSCEAPTTPEEAGFGEGTVVKQRRGQVRDHHQAHKSWPSTLSDTDSVGPGSGLGSPTNSTGDISKPSRPVSAATLSSNEDLEERDGAMTQFEQSINGIEPEIVAPTGPFRNVGLSKAAKTHRLRKLRTPSKCRECDSYVYFQGAECEECFLACHKKCLESLAIQCGHKKLQGRLQLFGRDFSQVLHGKEDAVPFIIKKCITEIERRALKMKGIYRVNGVKTRVEKLCQAFENGKELVELSQASPHDISNVLKLYLRQLPEPIMPFRMYNELMGLAKESLNSDASESTDGVKSPELVDRGPETEAEVLTLVDKLREVLKRLPNANIATLKYIIQHLRRVSELEQENKMSASNLGIVFGPTLMRPKPTGATVSLSSLVDYPHQARIVEALIVFQQSIFICTTKSPAQRQDSETGAHEEPIRAHQECGETAHGDSVGSSGSQERSLDSDSDVEDPAAGFRPHRPPLVSQESETSTEEDQLSPRASLDLSGLVPETIPEQSVPEPAENTSGRSQQ